MYVGLVHYDFVTLRRNFSHLISEHVRKGWQDGCDICDAVLEVKYGITPQIDYDSHQEYPGPGPVYRTQEVWDDKEPSIWRGLPFF